MTYGQARAYIESLQKRGWRLGLDRMQEFLRRIGDPHCGQKFFHVAGTNGKGTVTATIANVLKHAGYKTGAYFSPYVYDFRERIQINGRYISEEDVARISMLLQPIADELGVSEFEFKTAMGFVYWKENACEYVALEVGLGGRLDATNVVTPIVSIITEIGLDHQQYLGDTIPEIAREKAGIIKPQVPVVTGVSDLDALAVIKEIAAANGCRLITPTDANKEWPVYEEFLIGNNAVLPRLAIEAAGVSVSEQAWQAAAQEGRPPGRLEIVSHDPLIVFDGAHNAQAIEAVSDVLTRRYPLKKWIVVYSAATGHDVKLSVAALRHFSSRIYAAPMNHPRSITREELNRYFDDTYVDVRGALERAFCDLAQEDAILVTGSFYLLAEAKEALTATASNPQG